MVSIQFSKLTRIHIFNHQFTPAQVVILGFASIIFTGAILLTLPIASASGVRLGFVDALFTATSATCVTGLITVNTKEFFSLFGKTVIILLIQVGGLGFMTMSTLFALLIGKKITLRERIYIQNELNQLTLGGLVRLVRYVAAITLTIEGMGVLILFIRWAPQYGIKSGLAYALFHAVSAFCNAGFDLFGDSLVRFVGDITVNLVICGLIIVGGIGFTVIADFYNNKITKTKKRFSLHAKLVLFVTAGLILIGTVLFLLLEYNNPQTMGNLSLDKKILAALFQSVSPRTAGFNTIPIGQLRQASLFITIVLMFIGASPNSTGGGIKTTTFAVIVMAVIALVRGKHDVEVFERRLHDEIVLKSLAVAALGITVVSVGTLILLITQPFTLTEILFEAVSAFGTVGLSTGITPALTAVGKLILTTMMYLGRVGPLTLVMAVGQKKETPVFRFPEERIMVG